MELKAKENPETLAKCFWPQIGWKKAFNMNGLEIICKYFILFMWYKY